MRRHTWIRRLICKVVPVRADGPLGTLIMSKGFKSKYWRRFLWNQVGQNPNGKDEGHIIGLLKISKLWTVRWWGSLELVFVCFPCSFAIRNLSSSSCTMPKMASKRYENHRNLIGFQTYIYPNSNMVTLSLFLALWHWNDVVWFSPFLRLFVSNVETTSFLSQFYFIFAFPYSLPSSPLPNLLFSFPWKQNFPRKLMVFPGSNFRFHFLSLIFSAAKLDAWSALPFLVTWTEIEREKDYMKNSL